MSAIPTKTLRFDEDVLDVLRSAVSFQVQPDKTLAVIRLQLNRPLYERLNKALETMGGKWSRKDKAHVFPTDPRPLVDGLLDSGELIVEKDGFFETPAAVTARMIDLAGGTLFGSVLEPSAGMGAIVRHILQHPNVRRLWMVERNPDRAQALTALYEDYLINRDATATLHSSTVFHADFLDIEPEEWEPFDCILMNPPFENGQDIEHVMHAYEFLKYRDGVLVSVMSEGVFFRSDRKATDFREWLHEVRGYSEHLPEGSFKASGTGVNARLVAIGNYRI